MFLNPLMLAGIGGAMLPLVLHLLARSRFRTVDWAAMMFLQGADPRQRQSTKLRQILLLLLRMLLVALLSVALARPLVSEAFAAVASGGHVSAVLVIDGSLSTSAVEDGKPRTVLIRQAANAVLASLQKGDEAAIVVAGASPTAGAWTTDLAKLGDDVSAIQPAGRANLAEAMARAADLLNRPDAMNRRFIVISDRQAISWREVDAAFRSAWRSRAQSETPPTPLTLIPVGGNSADNLAVASVTVLSTPIVRDQPTELEVKIRNYGKTRRPAVPVAISLGSREAARATVDCPPESTVPVRLSTRFPEPGPQVVNASIPPSPATAFGLAADDSLDLAVDVTDATRVLILSGDERSTKTASESFFATIALQPFQSANGRPGPDPCKVTILPIDTARPADLQAAQVVVLANVPSISPAMAASLEQFVYDGGGVLLAPGSLTRTTDLNDALFRNGQGWLPAQLTPPTSADPTGLGQVDLAHPAMQFLRGRAELPPVTFGRWFGLKPRGDARVIASLASGDALAVECTIGRGRVMLLATPIDADWSTLPLTSFYLPFMQNSVRWLAGAGTDRNLSSGSPLVYAWTSAEPRTATLTLPDGRQVAPEPQRQGDRSEIRFAGTDQPGVYRLRLVAKGQRDWVVPFVVTTPSEESDLTPLRKADFASLATDLNARLIDPTEKPIADSLNANRAGREIWGLLVLAVIGCALLETWVSGRWSREE